MKPFAFLCVALCAATSVLGAVPGPYGVCAHLPRDEFEQRGGILRLMRVAGIGNARCDID